MWRFVDDGRAIGSEAATVETDVEENIVFKLRFFLGSVEQKLGIRFISLDTQFGFDAPHLIEPDDTDTVEAETLNYPVELLLRIVPENDPGMFFVEDFAQGFVELFGVHVHAHHIR